MQDQEVIALCRQGQTAKYALLVERYQKLIFGLALHLLQSPEEAEDVAQETFIRMYRQIEKNPDIDFLPYAKRVASNLCLDRLRRRAVEARYVSSTLPGEVIEKQTPERTTMEKAERIALRQALASLPSMYREVLVLCYGAELSYQQIADQLGVPLSIVKNRLYRGKRLLKDAYLHQEGGSENVL